MSAKDNGQVVTAKKRSSYFPDLLILFLLLGGYFGFQLGDRALWSPVEGHFAEIAREMVVSHDYVTPRLAGLTYLEKPPLFYWLESASIKLFGLNEWSLRLWPALFGMMGCAAVYVAGRKLFNRRVGLISCAVLATSSFWYVMSHVINLDMAVSSLITCALLSFLAGSEERAPGKRRLLFLIFYVFSALATLTKGLIGIVIPGLVIGTWIVVEGEWRIVKKAKLASGVLLFLLIAAPWYILVSREHPGFLRAYLFEEHLQRYLTRPDGPFEQPWAYVPVLLLGMVPWSAFMLQALSYNLRLPWRHTRRLGKIMFLMFWAGLVFLFFSGSSYKGAPYILPSFPPLAILIGRYMAAAWDSPEFLGIRAGCITLIVFLSILVIAGLAGPENFLERYANWPAVEAPGEGTVASTIGGSAEMAGLKPYIRIETAILVTLAILPLIVLTFIPKRAFRPGIAVLVLGWALFLPALNSSLPVLDERRSVKALAAALKPRLHPSDQVASFHAYYQDLPVYLERPVLVVGWKGNLQFGVEVNEHSGGWMTDDASFWKRWYSPATVYMMTERTIYNRLISEKSFRPRIVARGVYDILVSNKPIQG